MVKIETNPSYLKDEMKQKIRKSFLHSEFPAVLLNDFFTKEFYLELKKKVSTLDFKKNVNVLHHSYATAPFKVSFKELPHFISFVTKKKVDEINFTAYLLTWKDYQILNDRYLEKSGIDMIIDVTDHWDSTWGGAVTFTNGKGTIHPLNLIGNSVALVERTKGLQRYIQYFNHHGKEKKRLLLIASI